MHNTLLDKIINWSEVWSLIIPLLVILIHKPKGEHTRPLILYVFLALLLNSAAILITEFYFSLPSWLKNNNILYNLHSIIRVLFFGWYILSVRPYRFPWVLKLLMGVYIAFVIVNFSFFGNIFFLDTRLFAAESIVLLFVCISYFLRSIQDESEINWLKHPSFLVCMGVSLYEATSFFIFLFFYPLFEKNPDFGDLTMTIHNMIYIIFCIMLALALYRHRKQQPDTGAG